MFDSPRVYAAFAIVAALIAAAWLGPIAGSENHHEDLFIYSSGAKLALSGQSPYDVQLIHERVAEQYPDVEILKNNSGFFLAPPALLVMTPFAVLPWTASKLVWTGFHIILSLLIGGMLPKLADRPWPGWLRLVVLIVVVLNPLGLFVTLVGQTTILMLGCAVGGELLWRNGWRRLGTLLWAVAFFKPHLAFALLPLAWALNGWRRPLEILVWVGVLNLITGLLFFRDPLFVLDYLDYVQNAHQTVEFNRLTVNRHITAWNRLLYSAGGPGFELGIKGTLVGYSVLIALVALRIRLARDWDFARSKSWLLACAGAGMMVCCQVLPYELSLIFLALPFIGGLLIRPESCCRFWGIAFVSLLYWIWTTDGHLSGYASSLASGHSFENVQRVLESHRSLGCLLLLLGLLVIGPVSKPNAPEEEAGESERNGLSPSLT